MEAMTQWIGAGFDMRHAISILAWRKNEIRTCTEIVFLVLSFSTKPALRAYR